MAYNPTNPNGQATMANSSPVVVASDQSAVPVSGTVTVAQSTASNLKVDLSGTAANATAIKVDGSAVTQPVSGTFWQVTQPVSGTVAATQSGTWDINNISGTVSLPTGAATSAKQPALGTAGTPSSDVITVQGVTSMTALKVDGSAVTQPVSGTVTANAGTGSFTVAQATAANLNATVVGTGTFAVQADTELPAAAALADATANPTTTSVGSLALGYNGTTWDRLRTGTSIDGNGAVDLTGALLVKQSSKRINPTALGTATNSASTIDVNGSNNITVSIATTTTGTFVIEGTGDNTNWFSVEVYDLAADLWISGQSITPTLGKVYSILAGGLRQVRLRVNATLGATVSHFYVLDNSQPFIAGIDTGAAPHNFGYTLVHKDGEYSTQQTTTALWTPTTGKRFAVTDITISTGSTTAGIVTIYDAAAATAYSAGTTPAVFRGEFAPSATAKPGAIKSFNVPYVSTTANNRLHVTTSAAMTVYIQVNGYEI